MDAPAMWKMDGPRRPLGRARPAPTGRRLSRKAEVGTARAGHLFARRPRRRSDQHLRGGYEGGPGQKPPHRLTGSTSTERAAGKFSGREPSAPGTANHECAPQAAPRASPFYRPKGRLRLSSPGVQRGRGHLPRCRTQGRGGTVPRPQGAHSPSPPPPVVPTAPVAFTALRCYTSPELAVGQLVGGEPMQGKRTSEAL